MPKPNTYLSDERGWQLHHSDMYRLLGLDPKKHLPAEGVPNTVIQGITVWVMPKENAQTFHRVRCFCPDCGREMSFARLHQHKGFAAIGRGRKARACVKAD